ncbi:adenylosuccinate lyase [Halobacteriales archaeon QS_9_68_42]|nr:MAG: adenylosuccinate lyase [Halobacteriales archaeon QS_9_68_42]
MTDRGPLDAISPLDGRYARYTEPLSEYASEAALMRARVRVEVAYLLALADLEATPLSLDDETRADLRGLYESFDADDADVVKRLETEGYDGYAATNHDVKAVEYFVRMALPDEAEQGPWVHFGLTSEDVNNLAHRLLVKPAVETVLAPAIRELRDELAAAAREHRDVPMLARTHGQPATPTTYGKELAVYASRLGRALGRLEAAAGDLSGKLAGASGTYAAHRAAYPGVDWRAFAGEFVESLGLEHTPLTTQVNPCDDLAAVFDALRGVNKTKANSDLTFLADYVTTSRLQRDLSDSTVKRNVGAAFAHCLIGYRKTAAGLEKVTPNETVIREELEANPEVIGEAVQTILRREGDTDAYERVRKLTRGQQVDLEDFRELFDELDVEESVREELRELTPAGYTGVGSDLVDELDG